MPNVHLNKNNMFCWLKQNLVSKSSLAIYSYITAAVNKNYDEENNVQNAADRLVGK